MNNIAPTVVSPVFCGSVAHYLAIHRSSATMVNWQQRFDKRFKSAHRFTIADTHGRLDLTVPIAKPQSSRCTWGDIRISTHGNWWDLHRTALESAYGRTPYFDYYIDKLLPMLTAGVEERFPLLRDLSTAWDTWIRRTLLLPDALEQQLPEEASRLQATETQPSEQPPLSPYWQIRQDKLGFIPDLSILDLIFNLGPEAVIYLDKHTL